MVSGLLLGHIVSRKGIEVDMDKVRVILTLLARTCVREVRGFLGCVGYYSLCPLGGSPNFTVEEG